MSRKECLSEQEAADGEAPSNGPVIPQKLQHKITKRVRFLERVAGSNGLAVKGGTAKRKAKTSVSERLTDFTSLAASLAEAAEQVSSSGGFALVTMMYREMQWHDEVIECGTTRMRRLQQQKSGKALGLEGQRSACA